MTFFWPSVNIVTSVDNQVNKKDEGRTFTMKKYIYVIGLFYSFITFVIGFNHYKAEGVDIFGFGFMGMTPIISFVLATIWLREQVKIEEIQEKELE